MPQSAPRLFDSSSLVVASHNAGKVREICDLLEPFGVEVRSAASLNLPEPEETAQTFAGNAEIKAVAAARETGLPALSDDSGLVITALGGAPGVYSARWAGPEKDFASAMQRLHEQLGESPDLSAAFVCALCLAWPDGHTEIFEGRVEGTLCWPPRGTHGFGYDPFFVPEGDTRSFGEFIPDEKHAISHRARAFKSLIVACFRT